MKIDKNSKVNQWTGSIAMLLCLTVVVYPTISQASTLSEGSKGGGGGYVNYEVDKALPVFKEIAIGILEDASLPMFDQFPERRKLAIAGLRSLRFAAGEHKVRNHRELMFNYDLEKHQIIVLKPYWDKFGPKANTDANNLINDPDVLDFTVTYLLREVAHFWNQGSDENSDQFAKEVQHTYTLSTLAEMRADLKVAETIFSSNLSAENFDKASLEFAQSLKVNTRIAAIADSDFPQDGSTETPFKGGWYISYKDYNHGNLVFPHALHVAFINDVIARSTQLLNPMED